MGGTGGTVGGIVRWNQALQIHNKPSPGPPLWTDDVII